MSGLLKVAYARGIGLADALRLRPAIRWVGRRTPPAIRLRITRLLVRGGFDTPLVHAPRDDLRHRFIDALAMVPSGPVTYLEFGVYIGTSMIELRRAAGTTGRQVAVVGFDSFEGLPKGATEETDGVWHDGQYHADVGLTRANLRRSGVDPETVQLVPGWYDQMLTAETRSRLGLRDASIVMIDCDLASSTALALEFCTPLIRSTIIFFDDWDVRGLAESDNGEASAFRAWSSRHPELDYRELPGLRYSPASRAFSVSRS